MTQAKEAADAEWESFKTERATGVEQILELRKKAAEQDELKKADGEKTGDSKVRENGTPNATNGDAAMEDDHPAPEETRDAEMDVDDGAKEDREREPDSDKKEERAAADDDEAVEY